jgi:hypothetical protein
MYCARKNSAAILNFNWYSSLQYYLRKFSVDPRAESIEWFIEDLAFSLSYTVWLHLHPASCLSFSVFLCVAGRDYWWERGGRSQILHRWESLVFYKPSNTLFPRAFNPLVPLRTLEYVHIIFFLMLITLRLVFLFFSSLFCLTADCWGFVLLPPQGRYPPQSLHNIWS